MLKQVDEHTRLVFITQPGNPTGTFMSGEELRALHDGLPPDVVLVIDGAYGCGNGRVLPAGPLRVVLDRALAVAEALAAWNIPSGDGRG